MDAPQFCFDTLKIYERQKMIEVTLVASTPQDAYALAKTKYGSDFILISAKQIRYSEDDKISSEIKIGVSKERFLDAEVAPNETVRLKEELSQLRDQIAQMKQNRVLDNKVENSAIERVKQRFKRKGISPEWVSSVLKSLENTPIDDDEELLIAYLLEEIDSKIQTKEESFSGQKVMMLIGPTGVGKTTTIAKLAARYAYILEEHFKVALVNLDSFKVGAFEQLAHYADIMQLHYYTISSASQFKDLFLKLSEYDIVLIDTAGMSPYDTRKMVKTVGYLNSDPSQKIEVVLVVAATIKYEDILEIHNAFSFLNFDSVILSKFDETKHLGPILNYLLEYPAPLSYFCVGQEVPDDLVVADKEYLLARFVGDLDDEKSEQSNG